MLCKVTWQPERLSTKNLLNKFWKYVFSIKPYIHVKLWKECVIINLHNRKKKKFKDIRYTTAYGGLQCTYNML